MNMILVEEKERAPDQQICLSKYLLEFAKSNFDEIRVYKCLHFKSTLQFIIVQNF